jgi:hypothetical protein
VATGEDERVIAGKGWEGIDSKKFTSADFEKAFLGAFANAAKEPELNVTRRSKPPSSSGTTNSSSGRSKNALSTSSTAFPP